MIYITIVYLFCPDQAPVINWEEEYATTGSFHEMKVDASASYDPDQKIASFKWEMVKSVNFYHLSFFVQLSFSQLYVMFHLFNS